MKRFIFGFAIFLILFPEISKGQTDSSAPLYTADIKIAEGSKLLLANAGTREVVLCDLKGNLIRKWKFNEPVTGIAIDKNLAYVTSSEARGFVTILDINKPGKIASAGVGMGAGCPVLSPDKRTLYIAARFENTICKVEVKTLAVTGKVTVLREPCAMAVSNDGRYLFVNNFLPAQRADIDIVAADVSVIDLSGFVRIRDIKLSNGSNALRGICLSPDGNYLFVTHNLGRFRIPASQLEQGWMNTAGLSIIDVQKLEFVATVMLDEPEYGAAGSWDIKCSSDKIIVTHSGTHDISVIDLKAFMEKVLSEPNKQSLSYNLNFLTGIRQRYPLKGNGPRNFALEGNRAFIPAFFSDDLDIVDISSGKVIDIPLNPDRRESAEDKGRRIFNDASYCFQGWQSCNGCHPGEARTDGLNWDLLNDGIGNPKNCKSLLFAHVTPPAMISGIRGSAEVAVRAGFKHIQFSGISEEDAKQVDAYLKSLKPQPSPWLVNGELSESAVNGKLIFKREGCAECHSGEYYTDLKSYKIGEEEKIFPDWKGWDTPTLREVWRTAPYLFNGSAYDMKDVFEIHRHGLKNSLSKEEIGQLAEYVNSL
ncbi:MAG: YncE family protein [Bacteroidia bacterium]|nr:YncE family protein [Bacteroidia bacterium]